MWHPWLYMQNEGLEVSVGGHIVNKTIAQTAGCKMQQSLQGNPAKSAWVCVPFLGVCTLPHNKRDLGPCLKPTANKTSSGTKGAEPVSGRRGRNGRAVAPLLEAHVSIVGSEGRIGLRAAISFKETRRVTP